MMNQGSITAVSPKDKRMEEKILKLLHQEGIRRDQNLDYTCAMLSPDLEVMATGSLFGNTLRCLAVSSKYQGEGLMNQIITHLVGVQMERGNAHLFLYTKSESAKFFQDLGFYTITHVENQVVFMENRRNGFQSYLESLEQSPISGDKVAALVMNANPFTLGHQFLVEQVAAQNDVVHLFIVSEDSSLVPFSVRKRLILEGTSHLSNVVCHDSGAYIISTATFPSYFQKEEKDIIHGHARLDLAIFCDIAKSLGITTRYVGEEPHSVVTGIYNQVMVEELPEHGISCVIIPRKEEEGKPISASSARVALQQNDWDAFRALVPPSTFQFFQSEEGRPIVERIQQEKEVVHY